LILFEFASHQGAVYGLRLDEVGRSSGIFEVVATDESGMVLWDKDFVGWILVGDGKPEIFLNFKQPAPIAVFSGTHQSPVESAH